MTAVIRARKKGESPKKKESTEEKKLWGYSILARTNGAGVGTGEYSHGEKGRKKSDKGKKTRDEQN